MSFQLFLGNCENKMTELDNESIDLTVTSPPYDGLREYDKYLFQFETIANELWRITKKGGVVVWVVGDQTENGSETGTSFNQALYFKSLGFNLHDTMIYEKDSCPFPETTRYYPSFEYMFVLSKGAPKTVNLIQDKPNKQYLSKLSSSTQREPDGTIQKISAAKLHPEKTVKQFGIRPNIWRYSPGFMKSTVDKFAYEHPAIFPEKLAADHIVSWSNPGDVVFDPMMGSGTTGKMALKLQRNFIGIEISQKYYQIAKARIENEANQGKLELF